MAENQPDQTATTAYEPVDPSRVPSSQTAWLAGLAAFVLVVVGWIVWSQVIAVDRIAPPPPPVARPAPVAKAPEASGPVTLTALEDGVWVKVTDASGAQLFQKEMAKGESWTVPADAAAPSLRTAWPDALQVSIGAQVLPPLSTTREIVSGVVLTAEALRARPTGEVAPAQAATPAALPANPAPRLQRAPVPRPSAAPAPVATAAPVQSAEAAAPAPAEASAPVEASTETD